MKLTRFLHLRQSIKLLIEIYIISDNLEINKKTCHPLNLEISAINIHTLIVYKDMTSHAS